MDNESLMKLCSQIGDLAFVKSYTNKAAELGQDRGEAAQKAVEALRRRRARKPT